MALPSSPNQISLGDIRTEFGLAAGQIAMSSLYSKGNAPASGEIQIGADFHGVSAEVVLLETTITAGTRVRDSKLGLHEYGFSDGNNSGTGSDSYGSIANNSISSASRTVKGIRTGGTSTTANHVLTFVVSTYSWTGWTKIVLTKGSTVGTLLRTNTTHSQFQGSNLYSGNLVDANGSNVTGIFVNGQTTNFKLTL